MSVQVGDVVRHVYRWGDRATSVIRRCPGCSRMVRRGTSHCERCKTTFVPLTDDFVQVIGVSERGPFSAHQSGRA